MSNHSSASCKQIVYSAYRLGYCSVWYPFLANFMWTGTELEAPLPVWLEEWAQEISQRGQMLGDRLPRAARGRQTKTVCKTVNRTWVEFKKEWQADQHQGNINARDKAE